MKRLSFIIFALSFSVALLAKDIKTVVLTTQPEMHCQNCEKKIKNNIRFEKGIKTIKTNLEKKTVTIEYDADKTNVQNIIAGFEKINYKATEVKEKKK
ncbi:MAG: heavy-metal-associated domain-containing protein [Prevotella sp.]|jgi:copper chaperone CopZ|nr:heavy-metal-associated domain-containing protein [Prevotella sp.]MBR6275903.1 heavy-metal-associated domain-containing protein [Prevotella sp.]